MDDNTVWHNKLLLEKTAENLAKNGFDAKLYDTVQQAKEYVFSLISPDMQIAAGGSLSIKQLGLFDYLKEKQISLIQHKPEMNFDQRREIWRKAIMSDLYFASPQAVTIEGKLVFVDMYGNRVAAVIFGPKKVVLIAGYNKLVTDDETAMWRSRHVAGVQNAHRLNKKTPCMTAGKCMDCSSKDRICNVTTILHKKPGAADITIILVNEQLGH